MKINKDLLSRILYSTDASAYREMPLGVFYPESKQDLIDIVKLASAEGFSIIPRAAGTSLAGQVVGKGLVVDVSKHLNKILEINKDERWARVEPGVVLDELNIAVAGFGLCFGPETSTSNRCCFAGMVGNNSCGSHSLVHGSTRDHLLETEMVLCDGSVACFKSCSVEAFEEKCRLEGREGEIYRFAANMLHNERVKREIADHFPDPEVRRRNTGYAIDEFLNSERDICKVIAGSEGTLGLISEIKVNLVPILPKERALLCAHSKRLEDVFKANLIALEHSPVAVELMDANILELSKSNISQNKNRFFIQGTPAAILIAEFAAESKEELAKIVDVAESALLESGLIYYCSKVYGKETAKVWELRKAGLGLLTSMKGDVKPVSVIEDTAVAPSRLPDYMSDIVKMLENHSLSCVFHAHIGTGELHLRPLLNLKKEEDTLLFRTIAGETAKLVKKHRGSLSGEHGDGRLRGEFIPLMTGDYLFGILKELKRAFDPDGIFNPEKIIDTPPMNSSLRYEADVAVREYDTFFDYSAQGGWLRAVEQCNGSGDCRKSSQFAGTMCPSFRVTGNEADSTRGRANVLRELLTKPTTDKVFDQKEILESLDLCLSCKACKSECPSNVDMARYKAEFMQHYYDLKGVSFRSYMIARMADVQRLGSLMPLVYNFFACNRLTSSIIKKILRFSANRSIPKLSRTTLRQYAKSLSSKKRYEKGVIFLFADEFTNYNEAEVGVAFIELMNELGYRVIVPNHKESGRAAMSKGLLRRAKKFANQNVSLLKDLITPETPLVGIEPSAILSFRDEYPALVDSELREAAQELSKCALLYDEFIMREVEKGNISADSFTNEAKKIILHGHCHQKAIASVEPSAAMLSLPQNYTVETLPTGCCGMAGAFGYEKEHYDVSIAVGNQTLFPLINAATTASETIISAPGTSCRQQILDGTGRIAKHPVVILREALRG
ncbi:MAG: FAD-linked oxidase C-terminal domain-containing protein [Bacteroidales bacterium]|nr:FAD-linked oxidase C-terminal domain-containing protein [Bacteroidales bacterium]